MSRGRYENPSGCVYLSERSDGLWKIGFSGRPSLRQEALNSEFGARFQLVALWRHKMAYCIEQFAHHTLRYHRASDVRGRETYCAGRDMIIAAIERAIDLAESPWPEPTFSLLPYASLPEQLIQSLADEGEIAWLLGFPKNICPYDTIREREAWNVGWMRKEMPLWIDHYMKSREAARAAKGVK